MRFTHISVVTLVLCVTLCTALPVTKQRKDEKSEASSKTPPADIESTLEYERYLKEVVEALEADPDFRKKMDKTPEADIRSGKIAQELDYVNHHVRTKLDEIKRRELERLRNLANKEYEINNEIDREHLKVPQHLDHVNEHTFEIEDLRKLILKASKDLAEADRKRRVEFKEYEMQKEFEHQAQLKELDEQQRQKFEAEYKEKQEKHKKHEKIHHPGSKAQLEEVWEKQDHLDKQDFNPRTFFSIHDVDGNGYWDQTEVKAIFVKELQKAYQEGVAEDDMRERDEEMERMREHYFEETDTNHDGLISLQEFMSQTAKEEFQRDPEWETVDQQTQYTHEEYLEFERRRQEEVQRLIAEGLLPPHPNMPQGYYPANAQAGYQQHPTTGYQQQPPLHYQDPQQQHLQQQQQYQQQQMQYAQQQQLHQQPVQLNSNQVYQHVPQQPQPVQNQAYHQQPIQNQVYPQVSPRQPAQQNAGPQPQTPVQPQMQQAVPPISNQRPPPAVQNQQVPIQQQQQQQQQQQNLQH